MGEAAIASQKLVSMGGDVLEGPAWDARTGRLLLVDIPAGEVLALDWSSGRVERARLGATVSAVIPRLRGGEVLACRGGIATTSAGTPRLMVRLESERPWMRTNDAKCDPIGRLWVGTMADDERAGAGTLYRITAGWRCEVMLEGLTISNGLAWSPDGSRMYYIDSPTRRIDVFDYNLRNGEATGRRTLVDCAGFPGLPDGMTVDADGALWVAFYGGSVVRRFAPDGSPLAVIEVPTPKVTSCAFAGPSLERLVITTARASRSAVDQTGGDLFVAEPGVSGLPIAGFSG